MTSQANAEALTRPEALRDATGGGVSSADVSHGVVQVARLHRALAGQLLRSSGLHPAQELVMMHLWDFGPQRQTDIARLLGVDAATMTRTIQRLEQGGFVRRTPSPTDGRVMIVEPTAASRGLRSHVEEACLALEEGLTSLLTPEDRAVAVDLLARMEAGLEQMIEASREQPAPEQ